MFMTLQELREMTRAKQSKKICEWLARHGIAYRLDLAGRPVVLKTVVERAFDPQGGHEQEWHPNLIGDLHAKASKGRPKPA
jgi:hypothetical protein